MNKPLGRKAYGSIPHLPGSRRGTGDHGISEEQARYATDPAAHRKGDTVIVQEKLDGSNVCVARIGDVLHPLTRSGYAATTSPYIQHHWFAAWVRKLDVYNRFMALLQPGERACGEWLLQAHGTRYRLEHEPFILFDIIQGAETRLPFVELATRNTQSPFMIPAVLAYSKPCPIDTAMKELGTYGYNGALEPVEGAVWRVETNGAVNYLCKYVRPDKVDGKYLSLNLPVWNEGAGEYIPGFNPALGDFK